MNELAVINIEFYRLKLNFYYYYYFKILIKTLLKKLKNVDVEGKPQDKSSENIKELNSNIQIIPFF